jgi:hypothetical protein
VNSSESLLALGPDLLAAQKALPKILKKAVGQVGKMKTRYADLDGFLEIVEPVLNDNNIVLMQLSQPVSNGACVVTTLLHAPSGEWISDGGFQCPSAGNGAQGVGSAATYAKRYGLAAMLGISTTDDDGEAASRTMAQAAAPVAVTRPAARANTTKLNARAKALPESLRARLRDDIKKAGIVWSSMTDDQLKVATELLHDAENDANAKASA